MYSTRTIIRKVSPALFAIFLTMAANGVAFGQMKDESVLLGMTEFTIKPGHNTKFHEGVKAWKACYLKNEGTWSWDICGRLQGVDTVYVLSFFSENRDVLYENDEARQHCRGVSRELINPHVESSEYLIARSMPAFSNRSPMSANTKAIGLTYWTVNNTSKFMEVVNESHHSMKEKGGDISGYWFSTIGIGRLEQWASFGIVNTYWFSYIGSGPDDFRYLTVMPLEDSAQMDKTDSNAWGLLESREGNQSSIQAENMFSGSVDKVWSYAFTWVEDISRRNASETAKK